MSQQSKQEVGTFVNQGCATVVDKGFKDASI